MHIFYTNKEGAYYKGGMMNRYILLTTSLMILSCSSSAMMKSCEDPDQEASIPIISREPRPSCWSSLLATCSTFFVALFIHVTSTFAQIGQIRSGSIIMINKNPHYQEFPNHNISRPHQS